MQLVINMTVVGGNMRYAQCPLPIKETIVLSCGLHADQLQHSAVFCDIHIVIMLKYLQQKGHKHG